MPTRPRRRKSSRPPAAKKTRRRPSPPATRTGRPGPRREPGVRARGAQLLYKVVELSTVDEHALESTVNRWVREGWNLDGVQFAMRESSKRPSMAFVFFTRDDLPEQTVDEDAARRRLQRLAQDVPFLAEAEEAIPAPAFAGGLQPQPEPERIWGQPMERAADPWQRLAQLAGDDDEASGP